jgi:hypothetical protein
MAVSTWTWALSRFDSVTYVLDDDATCVEVVATRPIAGTTRREVEERADFDASRDACLRTDGAMLAMIREIDVRWLQSKSEWES